MADRSTVIGTEPRLADRFEVRASASETASAAWRSAREASGAGPHLSDGWIAYRRAQGLAPRFVTIVRGDAIAAIAVLYLRRPRFRPWVKATASADLIAWPSGTAEGTPVSRETFAAIARAVADVARDLGATRLVAESFDGPSPPPDFAAPELARLAATTRARYEFLLDLSPPTETRFAALKSSHRRKVRDGEKAGVTVSDETGKTPLTLLRELQGHTQERRAGRGEEMELPDPAMYARLEATLVAGDGGRLYVGRKDGVAMSAILCGVATTPSKLAAARGRAYYLMGGTSPAGFECNAATLVLWKASELLAQAGVATFNLGGVPKSAEQEGDPQQGLMRFKEGFGAARVDCTSATFGELAR